MINSFSNSHNGYPVVSVKFTQNGRFLLTSGLDSVPKLWDLNMGKTIVEYHGVSIRENYITACMMHDDDYVVSSDEKNFNVVVWDSRTGSILKRLTCMFYLFKHILEL